jgi:ATP-dependent protease HslVU (ClpYQ) peptidase subunit
MTAICGFRDPAGTVWIGADSRAINGSFIVQMECRKILRAGVWRIGQAGSAVAWNTLTRIENTLARCADVEALAIESRRAFRNAEFSDCKEKDHPGPPNYGQEILVACPSGIWIIEPDGTITEPIGRFLAVGRAQDICYGAAAILLRYQSELTGAAFLSLVLQTAADFNMSVAPPFHIERVC